MLTARSLLEMTESGLLRCCFCFTVVGEGVDLASEHGAEWTRV
jgi:hypothetical protein